MEHLTMWLFLLCLLFSTITCLRLIHLVFWKLNEPPQHKISPKQWKARAKVEKYGTPLN